MICIGNTTFALERVIIILFLDTMFYKYQVSQVTWECLNFLSYWFYSCCSINCLKKNVKILPIIKIYCTQIRIQIHHCQRQKSEK